MARRPPPLLPLALCLALAVPGCGARRPPPAGPAAAPPAAGAAPPADAVDALERQVSEAVARARASAVALEYSSADGPAGTRRVASGVVVSDDGDVLSVRVDAPPASMAITARVDSGRRLPARWVAADPETGLTLLRIEPGAARPATPALGGARLGAPVLVVGNPFGLGHSISRGSVAGLGRRLDLDPRPLGGLIQVDVALHPGDGGAMLADLRGGWLGVVRSALAAPAHAGGEADRTGRGREHDLGFAITATDALWVASQLRARRRVDRAYLGVTMAPADPGGPEGAVLGRVLDDTPAARAGLRASDRVVALDDRPVHSPDDLADRLDRTSAGAEVTVDLIRGPGSGPRPLRRKLRPARRPTSTPAPVPATAGASPPAHSGATPEELRFALPREVADRLDRLERRLEELERREPGPGPAYAPRP